MTLPASGQISMINTELGRTASTANTSLHYLETIVNTSSSPRPDGANPNRMSEWYSYEDVSYVFYESYQDDPCGISYDLYRLSSNNEFYYFDGSSFVSANALYWYQFYDYNPGTSEYYYNQYLVSYSSITYEGSVASLCPPA